MDKAHAIGTALPEFDPGTGGQIKRCSEIHVEDSGKITIERPGCELTTRQLELGLFGVNFSRNARY